MSDNNHPKKHTKKRIVLPAMLAIILVAAGIYLYAGWVGYQEAPKLIEVQDGPVQDSEVYALSLDQENALLSHSYPDAFTILFYEEETPNQDIQTVRLETWDYYTLGIGLTFINGALVSEEAIAWDNQTAVVPAPYYPEQFIAFMNLDDVLATGGIETYIEVPLNKELIDEGVLYYADSLSFGLQDEKLVYIEALALIE